MIKRANNNFHFDEHLKLIKSETVDNIIKICWKFIQKILIRDSFS